MNNDSDPRYGGNGKTSLSARLARKIANATATEKAVAAVIALLVVALIVIGVLMIIEAVNEHGYKYGSGGGGGGVSSVSGGGGGAPDAPSDAGNAPDSAAGADNNVAASFTYGENGIPTFIDGKFSEVNITDFRSAMMALDDIKAQMRMKSPSAEFVGKDITSISGGRKIYRLEQVKDGVPVYNKQVLIETSSDGKATALCADYVPDLTMAVTTKTSAPDANSPVVRQSGYSKIYETKLTVYTECDVPALVWRVDVGTESMPRKRLFVSADDGTSLVAALDLDSYTEASGEDLKGVYRTFETTPANGGYRMVDSTRAITVFDCGGGSEIESAAFSADNVWRDKELVSCAANIRDVYDFFKNDVALDVFSSGKIKDIRVYAKYRPNDVSTSYESASCGVNADTGTVEIKIGDGGGYARAADVMAHEFTHAIIRSTCGLETINESGAINEAYCTVMGVLFRRTHTDGAGWKYGIELEDGPLMNVSSPNRTSQPNRVGGVYAHDYCRERHDHTAADCDSGGIHTNAGIIDRAAYLMYRNGITDMYKLSKIFMTSLDYMVPTSDFGMCRAAVVHAARRLGENDATVSIIEEAFSSVGIE